MRVDECKEEEDEHAFAVAGEAQGGKLMVNIGAIPEEIIDSRASANVISQAMWEQLKKQQLLSSVYQELQRSFMPMVRLPLLK